MKTKTIILMLAAALAFQTRAGEPNQTKKTPEVSLPCLIVATVAASVVVYAVYRCARAAGLLDPPPPPQPPPTPPPVHTNAPPATKAALTPAALQSGPSPSAAPNFAQISALLVTNSDFGVELSQNIAAKGWTDPQGHPYTWLFLTQTDPSGPMTQTSTNLVDWQDAMYSVEIWISSTEAPDTNMTHFANMAVILMRDGVPLATNWCPVTAGAANAGTAKIGDRMFFRVKP